VQRCSAAGVGVPDAAALLGYRIHILEHKVVVAAALQQQRPRIEQRPPVEQVAVALMGKGVCVSSSRKGC
jgi:hypothetical protein